MSKLKIGIVGGTGYTGGELLRLALHHPNLEVVSITSRNDTDYVYTVHTDLLGQTDLKFTKTIQGNEDVLFLCLGHNYSEEYLLNNTVNPSVKIIDLSNEFRLKEKTQCQDRDFVYGLPELNKSAIKNAQNIANPGCFATAIQLAILPIANQQIVQQDIHVSAVTGSTGAGKNPMATTHFSWRNNNISLYKEFTHQHLGEINQSIQQLQDNYSNKVRFIPMRGDFPRGILAAVYTQFDGSQKEAVELYKTYYKDHPFVHITEENVNMKQVVNTNNVIIQIQKQDDQIIVTSVIDNLIKGASGQALQNLNLMMGWEETTGLQLKALVF